MDLRSKAGLGLVVTAVACLAGWGLRERAEPGSNATQMQAPAPAPARIVRVPADAIDATTPRPFPLDTATARAAVREGALRFEMPDGTAHVVPIERQYTDDTGHWNIVGRAPTRVGPQAMVLTFGADSVFGVVPMPDGHQLQIATAADGTTTVARAGTLVPEGREPVSDIVLPPTRGSATSPPTPPATITQADIAAAMAPPVPRAAADAERMQRAPVAMAAAVVEDTTPVQIDVLAYYAPELVTLRGSVATVETEVANLFAVANQAYLDSGTRVRLRVAGMVLLEVSATDTNTTLLDQMHANVIPGRDLPAERDTRGADLVTLIRPAHDFDGSCGVAYLAGSDYRGTMVYEADAYSVVNVAPCGPHVLAHELGHSLGSNHDRATATQFGTGVVSHGAFQYAFGYRDNRFATIMAYPRGEPWVGYFSNPASSACLTYACGIANDADNVRSINRMAPAIAAFRGPTGTVSIGDAIVLEPTFRTVAAVVPIRLSAPAPAGGVQVTVAITDGTATRDTDYVAGSMLLTIPAGTRETWMPLNITPDTDIEGAETVELQIASTQATVHDADATLTIDDDDPRPRVEGRLAFERGVPVPTEPISLYVSGLHEGIGVNLELAPPDFAYSLPVAQGYPLDIQPYTGSEFVIRRFRINEVLGDQAIDLPAERGVLVSGQLRAMPGMALPDASVPLQLSVGGPNAMVTQWLTLAPPDFAYRVRMPKNSDVFFLTDRFQAAGNANPFESYWVNVYKVFADRTLDIELSSLPTVMLCCGNWTIEAERAGYHGYIGMTAYLSAPAPAGGVTLRWRFVDGTAKRGEDYQHAPSGTVTIPMGETSGLVASPEILGDDKPEYTEYFDLVVDEVIGAQMPVPRARLMIHEHDLRNGGGHPIRTQN